MESNQENQNLNQSRVQKEKKSSNKLAILLLVIIGIVVFVWGIIYLGRMFAGGMENTKKDINKNIKGNIDSLNREMNKAIKDSMTIQRQAIDNKSSSWSRDLENYSNSNNNNYRSLERKVNCLIKTYSKKYDSLCKALDVKNRDISSKLNELRDLNNQNSQHFQNIYAKFDSVKNSAPVRKALENYNSSNNNVPSGIYVPDSTTSRKKRKNKQ